MKVLLIDDHPLILSALQAIIQTLDDAIDVATADTPEAAFELLSKDSGVELVLLDLSLGGTVDGFGVLADLRERHPGLPVVVVSATERLSDMVRAVDMGAMGFVPKRSSNSELFEALALVLAGGVFIPPALLGLVRLPGR
jgi:DNA-binding NarL/FixJ family response regulator